MNGFDVLHPVYLSPSKRIYAQPDGLTAVAVRRFGSARERDEQRGRREALLRDLGGCPWLNIPKPFDETEAEGGFLLIERMRLASADGGAADRPMALLRALDAMHEAGWVHMDVKPEHLLAVDGQWRLHDFDGAKRLGEVFRKRDVTYLYAPPEVLLIDRADPRDDLYAAALTLMTLRYGKVPYETDGGRAAWLMRLVSPRAPLPKGCEGAEAAFYRKALGRRGARFADCGAFRKAWNAAVSEGTGHDFD